MYIRWSLRQTSGETYIHVDRYIYTYTHVYTLEPAPDLRSYLYTYRKIKCAMRLRWNSIRAPCAALSLLPASARPEHPGCCCR